MSETAILDTRAAALLETWKLDHPKAVDATITLVEASTYWIMVEGACFRAVLLDGGTRAVFTLADPADVSVDLAPGVTRRLAAPPEPAPERDPALFDVADARRRSAGLLDRLRHLAERLRLATRHVATSHSDEVARLGALVPADAVDSAYRPVDHTTELRRMSREALETVALLSDLRTVLADAETFRRATGPRLRAALVDLENARRGLGSLAEVGSLATLGEVAVDRHSQHEVNLSDLEDRLDTLRRAVEEVAPLAARFEEAVRTHCSAMLETTRRAAIASATSTLGRLRRAAEALRSETEAEVLARTAAEALDVTAPAIVWPRDPLGVPVLETRNGERP